MAESWRIVAICSIKPLADGLIAHAPRSRPRSRRAARAAPRQPAVDDAAAPRADRCERAGRARPAPRARQARDRAAPPRLRARPDALLGLPVEDPAGRARRAAARLGEHAPGLAAASSRADPARLGAPRRRCRVGSDLAPDGRRARHRQHPRRRARFRSRTTTSTSRSSARSSALGALELLPRALERVAAGDPGDPQTEEGASWAGHFEDDDYVRIDWSHSARAIHNQVRAWQLTFGMSGLRAPVARARRRGGRRPPDAARPTRAATRRGSSAATARSGSSPPSPSERRPLPQSQARGALANVEGLARGQPSAFAVRVERFRSSYWAGGAGGVDGAPPNAPPRSA